VRGKGRGDLGEKVLELATLVPRGQPRRDVAEAASR
jgi:hypothetical protein